MNRRLLARRLVAPVIALALSAGCSPHHVASPSPSSPPDAETVIERYLEQSGGRERLQAVETLHAVGTVKVPDVGLEGTVTLWQRADGYSRTVLEIPGLGTIEEGTRPDLAWESSLMGPRIKRGEEKALALRNSTIEPLLDWRERYRSARVAGLRTVGERQAFELVLTAEGGAEQTHLIDTETYSPVGSEMTIDSPMGKIETKARILEAEMIDGVRIPTRIENEAAGTRMLLNLEQVELGRKIPEGTFDLPEEVESLLPAATTEED
jgi:hypothetical protein